MFARVLIVTLLTSFLLVGCSNSKETSKEDLELLISLAKIAGAATGATHDSGSDGPKSTYCMEQSRMYIVMAMGFDGSNGTKEMGEVQAAYYRACLFAY